MIMQDLSASIHDAETSAGQSWSQVEDHSGQKDMQDDANFIVSHSVHELSEYLQSHNEILTNQGVQQFVANVKSEIDSAAGVENFASNISATAISQHWQTEELNYATTHSNQLQSVSAPTAGDNESTQAPQLILNASDVHDITGLVIKVVYENSEQDGTVVTFTGQSVSEQQGSQIQAMESSLEAEYNGHSATEIKQIDSYIESAMAVVQAQLDVTLANQAGQTLTNPNPENGFLSQTIYNSSGDDLTHQGIQHIMQQVQNGLADNGFQENSLSASGQGEITDGSAACKQPECTPALRKWPVSSSKELLPTWSIKASPHQLFQAL